MAAVKAPALNAAVIGAPIMIKIAVLVTPAISNFFIAINSEKS
jgi:hypothetical protein